MRIIVHKGTVYADVVEFIAGIILDLQQVPPEMMTTSDEIIRALEKYVKDVLDWNKGVIEDA